MTIMTMTVITIIAICYSMKILCAFIHASFIGLMKRYYHFTNIIYETIQLDLMLEIDITNINPFANQYD